MIIRQMFPFFSSTLWALFIDNLFQDNQNSISWGSPFALSQIHIYMSKIHFQTSQRRYPYSMSNLLTFSIQHALFLI